MDRTRVPLSCPSPKLTSTIRSQLNKTLAISESKTLLSRIVSRDHNCNKYSNAIIVLKSIWNNLILYSATIHPHSHERILDMLLNKYVIPPWYKKRFLKMLKRISNPKQYSWIIHFATMQLESDPHRSPFHCAPTPCIVPLKSSTPVLTIHKPLLEPSMRMQSHQ